MTDKRNALVDQLAQEIRRVDGSHSLGAGALAEALMPFVAALAALAAPVEREGWKPIETAPQREVLLYYPPEYGRNAKEEWVTINHPGITPRKATHWMPLPEPPR